MNAKQLYNLFSSGRKDNFIVCLSKTAALEDYERRALCEG